MAKPKHVVVTAVRNVPRWELRETGFITASRHNALIGTKKIFPNGFKLNV